MGYVIPPRLDSAARFRKFLQDSSTPGSTLAQGLSQFETLPAPVQDLSSWTPSGATAFRSLLLALPIIPPPISPTDPYSQLYLSGQALGRLISVQHVASTSLTFKIGSSTKTFAIPSVNATTPHQSAPIAYREELQAQNVDPELFLLWVCRSYTNEINFPGRLEKLCALIDVAAIALPEALYKAKRLPAIKRPYQIKSVMEFLPRPGHSSWPGGHSFAMGAISTLILEALENKISAPEFMALKIKISEAARRIANNREGAGLHWADDAKVGLEAGEFVISELLSAAANSTDTDIQYLVTLFRSIP